MRPVFQKDGDGLCFAACVATLLGVGLDEVPWPPPTDDEDPTPAWNALRAWLRGKGLALVHFRGPPWKHGGAPFIVGGNSPRGVKAGHAVIMQGGEVVHDPHPDQTGLTSWDDTWALVPIAPWERP